jgi:SAM-dependent methyltransferase
MNIPWWLKIGAKLVLSRLPFGYAVWQKLGMFRHGAMDTSDYALGVFDAHMAQSGLLGQLRGKTILELGPGDSISTAIIAAAYGARAILVDAGRFVRTDVAPYRLLARILSENGLPPPDLSSAQSIDEILDQCDAMYLSDGLRGIKQLETGSVDLIFSQAVLEHVRRGEFLETMLECRRILKPTGVSSHRVDLRDHLGGALNNLRFSEKLWESEFFASSGFYTNRIQYSQMLALCLKAGFKVDTVHPRHWETLPTPRNKFSKMFQSLPDEELCVSGFDVLLR